MGELEQLRLILQPVGPDELTYWNDDRAPGYYLSVVNGMRLDTMTDGNRYRWRITRPDRSEVTSPDSFPSRGEAKAAMRKVLADRRSKLEDDDIGPASVSMHAM
jgi:hypothetical protein